MFVCLALAQLDSALQPEASVLSVLLLLRQRAVATLALPPLQEVVSAATGGWSREGKTEE